MTNSADIEIIVTTRPKIEDVVFKMGEWSLTTTFVDGQPDGKIRVVNSRYVFEFGQEDVDPLRTLLSTFQGTARSAEGRAALEAKDYVPPMWGLWLIDPSGKYGYPHKVFAMTGETPEDAFQRANYGRGKVQLDPDHAPYLMNPARGEKPTSRPVALESEIRRHAEKQGVSWDDAWAYFESNGYDMSQLGLQL